MRGPVLQLFFPRDAVVGIQITFLCCFSGKSLSDRGEYTWWHRGEVAPYLTTAHAIIYVSAVFSMYGALMLFIFGRCQLVGCVLDVVKGKNGFAVRLKRMPADPLQCGALWQTVFMNFTVNGVGILMAIRFELAFRLIPFR